MSSHLELATDGPAKGRSLTKLGYAFYVACLLCLANTLATCDRYLVTVALEHLKRDLHLSDTQLGLLQGPSFVVMYFFLSIPLGRLADVGSRRLLIFGGIMVWTAATLAEGLATNFGGLLAARLFVGIGEAALIPAAMSLVVAYFPKQLVNRGVSMVTAGGPLGQGVGYLAGGFLLRLFDSMGVAVMPLFGERSPWQALFISFGLAGLVMAALILTIKEPARPTPVSQERPTLAAALRYFWAHKRAFLPLFISFSMLALILQAMGAWSMSLLTRERGMDVAAAGSTLGICGLVFGLLGNVLGGWLADRLDARGLKAPHLVMLAVGLAISVVGGLLLWLAPSAPLTVAAYVLVLASLITAGVAGYGGAPAISPPEHRGMMSSLFMCTYILFGAGLGPFLIGLLSDSGLPSLGAAIFAVTLVAAGVGAPLAWLGRDVFEKARVRGGDLA